MELSELTSLLGNPVADPFPVDWPAVESWLGCRLPTAYKEVGSTFGPWYVGDWLWVEVPCAAQGGYPGYTRWLPETTRHVRIRAREDSATIPVLYPKEGGLLAWGHTRQSEVLFWDTSASDNSDEWPVVFYVNLGPLNDPWRHTGLTTLDFLAKVVVDGIPINAFRSLGPLPRTAKRTAYRTDAAPWTPPAPDVRSSEEMARRRRALVEGSGLDALKELVPPPRMEPVDDQTWRNLVSQVGTGVPTEYVDLMNTYGAGTWWKGELRFPAVSDLTAFATETADAYRELREQFPDDFPLAVWPEPAGFFAFADSADGDCIGWLTVGGPDDWPVVVWPRHNDQGPPLEDGLINTLLTVLRGKPVSGFTHLDADDDPLDFATFAPFP